MNKQTRRNFFKTAGLGVFGLAGIGGTAYPKSKEYNKSVTSNGGIELGVASYGLRKLSLEQTIDAMGVMKIKKISIKSMHLPLESSNSEIETAIEKLESTGLAPYACGVVYMKSKEQVDNAFRYAKAAGFKIMVSVPNYELLDYVEEKVKQYNIIIAIHNHGPDGLPYPSPQDVMERVKGRDKRIGICMDVAHVARAGIDPVKAIKESASRLYDLHLRDTSAASKEGKPCRPGSGVIDLPAVMKALQEVNYQGVYCIEYGAEADNPVPATIETAGYLKGIGDTI